MAREIPTEALSEGLERALEGRRVCAAVFTTYVFDPAFFEREVLPVLFPRGGGHASRGRLPLLFVEDQLEDAGPVAVYYARRGLVDSGESPKLDVRRIPLERRAVFHLKMVLVLVENEDAERETTWRSLVVGVLSANLTEEAWWVNVECAWLDEIAPGDKCSYRRDLLQLLNRIRREDWTRSDEDPASASDHRALETIHGFVRREAGDAGRRKRRGVVQPRLFLGQSHFADFVADVLRLPEDTYNLEVLSPYFDDTATASALEGLIEAWAPKETRVHLPRADDGSALCSEAYYERRWRACRARAGGVCRRRWCGAGKRWAPRIRRASCMRRCIGCGRRRKGASCW